MGLALLILSVILCFAEGVPFRAVVQCPPSNDIYPCYCSEDPYLTSINCESFSDIAKIRAIMDTTKGINVSYGFWKSRLGDIPSDFFQGQLSSNLHFENCKIGSFGDRPFSGLENSLKRLFIYQSIDKRIKDLETFPLSHLKLLNNLAFQANDINKVGNEWFAGGPSTLEQVSLEANDIEELGDKAFVDLVNVEQFWLGDNRYKVVSRSMFPRPATKIYLLEMSFSEIEVLPEDMFTDMPNIKVINVSGNKFKSLPQSTWGVVWNQLEEAYVDRTQLQCDENVKWIFERKLPKILDGRCYGDNKLRGKKLEEMSLKDFE